MSAEEKKEDFLHRWSRRKHEQKSLPEKKEETPAPPLPALDKLTPESDFTGFMHPKVDDALRRVALKKLFRDPHFNIPDPYEAYSGDWTGGEPIPPEMMAGLNQAKQWLFDEKPEEKKEEVAAQQPAAEPKKPDEPGKQDA
jgi:hypothetical protein